MASTHTATLRNAMADLVLAAIDAGSTVGYIELQDNIGDEIATLALQDPAGSVSGAQLTFDTIDDDTNATGGTVTQFEVFDSDDNSVFSGSVGTSGEDLNLTSVILAPTETASIAALTYDAPL